MQLNELCRGLAAALLASSAIAGAAVAQDSVADFYKGHDITFIIGSGEGGGYDTYSRVLARHLSKHIPGEPNIVAQNMPGASSVKAGLLLYGAAPKDGTTIAALYNTIPLTALVQDIPFDPAELNWIGSMGKHQNICFTWHTAPVDTFDGAKETEVVMASTGPTGNSTIYPTLFNEELGTKFKIVEGYKSSEARLAVERGEADGICGMSYQTLLASSPSWFEGDDLNILVQMGLKPHPGLEGVPMGLDMLPEGETRGAVEVMMIPQEMGRPIVAPPGVPEDRLAALRTAFDETMEDPEFLADAERTKLFIEPLTGDQVQELVDGIAAKPGPVLDRVRSMLGGG